MLVMKTLRESSVGSLSRDGDFDIEVMINGDYRYLEIKIINSFKKGAKISTLIKYMYGEEDIQIHELYLEIIFLVIFCDFIQSFIAFMRCISMIINNLNWGMYTKDQKFSFFDYEQLTKDFCYNKPLSIYFRTNNARTNFELQELVEVRSGKCFLTDSAKLSHRFGKDKLLQTTLGNGSIKLYYGYELGKGEQQVGGSQSLADKKVEQVVVAQQPKISTKVKGDVSSSTTILYSRLFADRKLQNASIQFGISKTAPNFQFDTNLSAFLYERQSQYFLYGKFLYKSPLFNAGVISLFDYGCRNLQTNNVVLEVKPHPKHQIFLRGQVDGLRNYSLKYSKIENYFDYFIVDYIARPTQTLALMAEYKYDFNAKRTKTIQSIIEKRFKKNTLKFGINQLADLTFQTSFPLSLGKDSKVNFGIQVADILKSRKISYGFRVDINAS